jgi:hypothetical protein
MRSRMVYNRPLQVVRLVTMAGDSIIDLTKKHKLTPRDMENDLMVLVYS